jgi:zinc/manganese transport system ATP-binding protein
VRIDGQAPRRGSPRIGYIPQQKAIDEDLPLRARDLVGLGLDGHRLGLGLRGRRARRARVDAAIEAVGAWGYADAPVGRLSGGEQQRLRVAQALVGDPSVLLCDEPLLSLDLANQRTVSELIDRRRRLSGSGVLFVTHEINPVLPMVDRVLYLVDGRFRIGPPDEVMTSGVLSELYRTEVDVLRVRDRLVVVGVEESAHHHVDGGDAP